MVSVLLVSLLASCKTAHHASGNRHGAQHHTGLNIGPGSREQQKIISAAKKWIGTPYKFGGAEKGEGADCSGFVLRVYEEVTGIKIPRTCAKQAEFCATLKSSEVEKGDLVFYATGKDPHKVSHVGIIVDDEHFIHASSSKGVVISNLDNNYFVKRFKKYGRIPRGDSDDSGKHKKKKDRRKKKNRKH